MARPWSGTCEAPTARRLREWIALLRLHAYAAERYQARLTVKVCRAVEDDIRRHEGVELFGLRMLDLGGGQMLRKALYFANMNDVVVLSHETIPRLRRPLDYVATYRHEGIERVAKTLFRRLSGADRVFRRSLARELGVRRLRIPEVRVSDLSQIPLPNNHVDFAYAMVTFEHVAEPAPALAEVVRVLRPGGVAHVRAQLWTSEGGAHDPRALSGRRGGLAYWPHLRPQHEHEVLASTPVNRMRLAEWVSLFRAALPGARIVLFSTDRARRAIELTRLRAVGELAEFDDEELLTSSVAAVWQKPMLP